MVNERTPVVLVADDDPSMLTLVAQHARTLGYQVIEASDGEEAWELARKHLPDLIVLDVMMPGMNGWEVCRKVREDVALAHTGVVMLTGMGESLNALTSPLYGADEYIDKPFEFAELDEKIQATLEKRASLRQGVPGPEDGGEAPPKRRRPAAKKAAKKAKKTAKKAAAKRPAARKPVAKKAAKKPAKKTAAKKAAPTKVAKKPARKTAAKKTAKKAAKKVTARKGPAKKVARKAARNTVARKAAPAKAPARKVALKRAAAKKTSRKPRR